MKGRGVLKIPEGAIRRANELDCLKDLEFYYELKALRDNGFFRKGEIVSLVKKNYGTSESSVWRKIKRLLNIKLVRRYREGYRLVNYDTLFEYLGYDLEYNFIRERKGSFKIFKIDKRNVSELITYTAKEEIKLNLTRQAFKVFKSVSKQDRFKELHRNHTQIKPKSLKEIQFIIDELYKGIDKVEYLREIKASKDLTKYIEMTQKTDIENEYVNLDIALSNRGIAKLLGYKSQESGFKIQKRLVELGLIQSQKRQMYLGRTSLSSTQFKKQNKDKSCKYNGGYIVKNIPNKIVVLE